MKKLLSVTLASFLFVSTPHHAQAQAAQSVADRSKALNTLFAEIWEDRLQHSPEFASSIGDKRWNDQLTDYPWCVQRPACARREYLLV